mgnify:CR=1 FL=1|jgi:thiol-disulfide isomerase/thioredoxin
MVKPRNPKQKSLKKKSQSKKKNLRKKRTTIKKAKKVEKSLKERISSQIQDLINPIEIKNEEIPQDLNTIKVINKKTDKPKLVLIYADWCIHCQTLKPNWNGMKAQLINEKNYNEEDIFEIESGEQEQKLLDLNGRFIKNGEHITAGGYPTLGKIKEGKFNTYTGGRSVAELCAWAKN